MSFRFLLVCILALFPVIASAKGGPAGPVGVIGVVASVERVSDRIKALGTIKANESVELTVSVPEIVATTHFEDGQEVKAGDVLVQMASDQENALLQEARHRMDEAESQLERVRTVAKKGVASQSLLDQRQREYNVARAQLTALESGLKDRRIIAPFDGRIGLRMVSPGAYLAPGDVITTLVDDSQMKLDVSIPSIYLAAFHTGLEIEASTKSWGEKIFPGTVTAINNRVDPVTRTIIVRAVLPNPEALLKPGQLMEVTFLARDRDALVIPEESLVPEGNRHFVYLVTETEGVKTANRTEVAIGTRWKGKVEIIEGIAESDTIITHGANKVRPGSPVKVTITDSLSSSDSDKESSE